MATTVPLDTRQAHLARLLLSRAQPSNLGDLAAELRLTHRVVRYNLDAVESFLREADLALLRRRGVGVWIEGSAVARSAAIHRLDIEAGPAVLDLADRISSVLLALLDAAPDPIRSEAFEARLEVSRPTVRRDVRAAEAWLEQHRLHLRRLPGVGLTVRGSEVDVRSGILALILENMPANVLAAMTKSSPRPLEASPALADYLATLNLPAFRAVLAGEIAEYDDRDPAMLTATVSLAILARRAGAGRPARLGRGRLRSLLDHPVSDTAQRIASVVEQRLGVPLSSAEVAAVTESLLAFVELAGGQAAPDAQLDKVVDRIVSIGASRLHRSLADDDLLRASLMEHVRRLVVRLRYSLPVSNPLRDEVRKRYPDVYLVAQEIIDQLGPIGGAAIPGEEVSFLTMYLAGSLERHSLRSKVRVTVVCPAGMATAWILVSRLLAEFPQLEVARVVSKTTLERESDGPPTDLVISTIPLDEPGDGVPTLVVSPLLSDRDVRQLSRLLGQPARH